MPKLFDLNRPERVKLPKSISYRQWIYYFLACLILVITFSAYYTPDMMVAVVNQVWGLCGW